MINIVSCFTDRFQSRILQTFSFNNVSVDSEEFPEVKPCFPANAKHSKKTYGLHQAIRCFYFVTIVTFPGDKFHRKFTQANQKTFQESFTRNNVKIFGFIVIFYFYYCMLRILLVRAVHIFPMLANSAATSQTRI